jgi:hypothetical protein
MALMAQPLEHHHLEDFHPTLHKNLLGLWIIVHHLFQRVVDLLPHLYGLEVLCHLQEDQILHRLWGDRILHHLLWGDRILHHLLEDQQPLVLLGEDLQVHHQILANLELCLQQFVHYHLHHQQGVIRDHHLLQLGKLLDHHRLLPLGKSLDLLLHLLGHNLLHHQGE